MIPGTALPATRPVIDDTVQPVPAAKAISDILSEFSPGQRLQAVIQGQTANGTYRAIIAQRDVTLALPFAAKSGDALELEVVETQGRLALAVVAKPDASAPGATANAPRESVTTTLSQTARLIGALMSEPDGERAGKGTPLNAGQALVPATAGRPTGGELAPALAKAVTQSGLFFEAHQAAWVAGRVTRETLLAEPQGRLPATVPPPGGATPAPGPGGSPTAVAALVGLRSDAVAAAMHPPAPPGASASANASVAPSPLPGVDTAAAGASDGKGAAAAVGATTAIPGEVRPIVQQQLSALASNVYAFHGQAWPGQDIHWEIIDADGQGGGEGHEETAPRWQTRLRLSLPSLGAVDAALTLQSGRLAIRLDGRDETVATRLQAGVGDLRQHLHDAGVTLASLDIRAAPPARDDGA